MADKKTVVVRGKLHWAKVIGDPRLNTFTNEREWSVDVTPDQDGKKRMIAAGFPKDRFKDPNDKEKDDRTEDFFTLRQREYREDRKTGERTKNKPIKIIDAGGNPWPEGKLLGNETVADVKFDVVKYGAGKPTGVYIQAIRVLDLVEYESNDFEPLSEDDEYFASGSTGSAKDTDGDASPNPDDLDDDIPF